MIDIEKYNQIVAHNYTTILKYCLLRLSFVKPNAEEVADDVFITLFLKWDELDLSDNITAWLYRVADNCIKRYNAKKSDEISLDECKDTIERFNVYEDDIEALIEQITYKQELERIISDLPDNLKDIFIYRFVEGKPLQEVEKITGIPYSTVRLRIKKIIGRLSFLKKPANMEEKQGLHNRTANDSGKKGGDTND